MVRPRTGVALLLAILAVLLGLGELWRPLVSLALVLDAVVGLAFVLDVILRGRLGLSQRSVP
jgi:hypothetical protein